MKKILSIVLSLAMVFAVMAVSAIPAMADVASPTATIAQDRKPILEVNGSASGTDITYTVDPTNPNKVTFEYNGDGTLVGWENNLTDDFGFVEGTDYEAVFNEDGTYTVTFISKEAIEAWNSDTVVINALVEFDEDTTATTGKPNGGHQSPPTGAPTSAIAATVAVAGAGFAVLAAAKKRDAE